MISPYSVSLSVVNVINLVCPDWNWWSPPFWTWWAGVLQLWLNFLGIAVGQALLFIILKPGTLLPTWIITLCSNSFNSDIFPFWHTVSYEHSTTGIDVLHSFDSRWTDKDFLLNAWEGHSLNISRIQNVHCFPRPPCHTISAFTVPREYCPEGWIIRGFDYGKSWFVHTIVVTTFKLLFLVLITN